MCSNFVFFIQQAMILFSYMKVEMVLYIIIYVPSFFKSSCAHKQVSYNKPTFLVRSA